MNNFAVKSTKCGKSLWSVYEGLAFQSTPPLGRRLEVQLSKLTTKSFQSTPPRGRRQKGMECPFHGEYFNPRLRKGGDLRNSCYLPYCIISIHASAREATFSVRFIYQKSEFQSTPPRGRRLMRLARTMRIDIFQSTPPRGRRPSAELQPQLEQLISIHASAREATALITNFYI